MRRSRLTVAVSLYVGICTFGCARPDDTIGLNSSVLRPDKAVVIFFVDGMDRRRFEELLDDGLLPNIEQRFIRGGVGVEHAIVSMPAITYPNAVSLLTGLFPGHHGVLGNQWFDHHTLQYQAYLHAATYRSVNEDFTAPTLYDLLRDQLTINVQCHTRRGVTCTIDNWAESGIDWFLGDYINVDRRVGSRIRYVTKLANHLGRWPIVLMNYFPAVDQVGHHFGVNSPNYARAMQNVDSQVGRIADAVNQIGMADRTYFALITDHGHVQHGEGKTFDIADWLELHGGLRIRQRRTRSRSYLTRLRSMNRYDAVVINGAYRRVGIHLKGPQGWHDPVTQNELQRILDAPTPLQEHPGVALLCLKDGEHRVKIMSRDGDFIVERRGHSGRREYRIVLPQAGASSDPLRYRAHGVPASFTDQGWHGSRDWLAATAATRYPDFVPQVVEMFDSPRAGDLVVFASEDWAFCDDEPSGHGSCLAEDMRVPMYFAGPSLPPGGRIDHARLVDLMPTILGLLDEATRLQRAGPIDGINLAPQLKSAARPKSM
ncbi:MAG: alkaline phosphatase family protein [Phycisphaerales bacterium]|nr:alkaline phosphatase family protein [Phycisphaerales bacterium]